mmetsp:Transcript_10097/g.30842  ORF Transcript_10097/g.30842 Transcript_10097/m.30842 type:complete len:439 (+) Transcript_10097:155-1471(+)|eukprot:CAMPEP_0198723896 /NCGR_PEP_ID=MMETSP1475-20131203/1404_1 /TAXON_ID= ORGANISM="Unidentified sp., Strain CCMP1999" /NCGR_SAMPLE_ID=MMETSP1475 /ASSEMBLY_ACC=CAM_ASM_001111 /LENGTH=438 /DNA_ID=CAMNT_0044485225 /DNA_START=113 /DNA_END=1429 /DNA_ORIENTATION=-
MYSRGAVMVVWCVVAFVVTVASGVSVKELTPKTLNLVVEVCRHGDRAPLYTFPADKLPFDQWPQGRGQLTPVGARAHYELGRKLRDKYVDTGFLESTYNQSQVYVRSTDVDRTLMSAMSQMAGLYPHGTGSTYDVREGFGEDAFDPDDVGLPFRWQLVPVHTKVVAADIELAPGVSCPLHARLQERQKRSDEWARKTEEVQPLCDKVKLVAGLEVCNLTTISQINDIWICDESHDIAIDPRVSAEERDKIREAADWVGAFVNRGEKLQRMRAGALLYEVKDRLLRAVGRTTGLDPLKRPDLKFYLLSAHDTTVASLLSGLQIFDGANPPYNSTVIYELHTVKKQSYVTISYNDVLQTLSGCSKVCPLDRYLEVTKSRTVSPEERTKICYPLVSRSLITSIASGFVLICLGGIIGFVTARAQGRLYAGFKPLMSNQEVN